MDTNFTDIFKLTGKVAVVTGARRGMGKAHALALSLAGAFVVIADVSIDECKKVVEEIREKGGDAFAIECDISKKEDVDVLVEKTKEKYEGIDILVNNAGILDYKNFFDLTEEDWNRVIDVNLKGTFLCTQAVSRVMKDQGGGSIVNIGSIAMGQSGIGFPDAVPYIASKGGIAGITEALAVDLAPYNIRVNAIAPGIIETSLINSIKESSEDMEKIISRIPLKRCGKTEEVSAAVIFLSSPAASYITGAIINIDGGWLAA